VGPGASCLAFGSAAAAHCGIVLWVGTVI